MFTHYLFIKQPLAYKRYVQSLIDDYVLATGYLLLLLLNYNNKTKIKYPKIYFNVTLIVLIIMFFMFYFVCQKARSSMCIFQV